MRVAIDKARADRTAIVVVHRLTTILNADQLLVIDQGRIVEMGSRTELLARQGLFFDLYQAQPLESEQQRAQDMAGKATLCLLPAAPRALGIHNPR